MPAIAPPDRPLCWAAAAALLVAVGVLLEVEEGNSGGRDAVDGNVTPGHLLVTLDPTQQESVALGELVAQ